MATDEQVNAVERMAATWSWALEREAMYAVLAELRELREVLCMIPLVVDASPSR